VEDRLSEVFKPNDEPKSTAEAYAAVAATFTESLTQLARLIIANDATDEIRTGAAKAYEAVYNRMVWELDPRMEEMRGQTKH
jgi:hypothetical protein